MNLRSIILGYIQRLWSSLPHIEPIVLVVLALGTASLWGFIETADAVFANETQAFDQWMLLALRNPQNPVELLGPHWIEEVARDASALGGIAWITFSTIVIAIYLWIDGKLQMALFLLTSTTSGALVSVLLKSLFARPRPEVVPYMSQVYSSSFPSAHSMIAAVVYLTVGSLLASVISKLSLKIYVLTVAVMLTTAVGLARIYLGVHYPTDVLAGWLAGLVWALLCWLVARYFQNRGSIESAPNASHRGAYN
jgi:undecaprenyl-diphosphatase